MKNAMQMNKLVFGLLFMGALFTACSPEDGADGITGPQGPRGEQGVPGEQGEQGEQGETGTADVIYSDWIPSGFPATINGTFDQFEIDAPELNEMIQDEGVLLVYARKGTVIYPLPYSFFGTIDEYYGWRLLTINDDIIAIRVHSTDDGNIGEPFLNDEYRYVIIPGGVAAGRSMTATDYEDMSYEQITQMFDIRD